LPLKWFEQVGIVEKESELTRQKTERAIDWLAEQKRLYREQQEQEARESKEQSAEQYSDYLISMQRAKAADAIDAANKALSELGYDPIPISESTVRQQIVSGGTWLDDVMNQARATSRQTRIDDTRKEAEEWVKWEARKAGASWADYSPAQKENLINDKTRDLLAEYYPDEFGVAEPTPEPTIPQITPTTPEGEVKPEYSKFYARLQAFGTGVAAWFAKISGDEETEEYWREAQASWKSLAEIAHEGEKALEQIDTVPFTLTTEDGEEIELTYNPSDSTVWKDNMQVGTIDGDSGDFIPRELVGQKILSGFLTGLGYLFYPFTGFGMLTWSSLKTGQVATDLKERAEQGEDVSTQWQELTQVSGKYTPPDPLQVEIMRQSGEFEDIDKLTPSKEWLPGGEVYEDYRNLPWYQQLLYELPAWALLAVTGGATGLSKILEASASKSGALGVAAKGTQVALKPLAGYEAIVGKVTGGITNKILSVAQQRAVRTALRNAARQTGIKLTTETENALISAYRVSLEQHINTELVAWMAKNPSVELSSVVQERAINYLLTHASPKWSADMMVSALKGIMSGRLIASSAEQAATATARMLPIALSQAIVPTAATGVTEITSAITPAIAAGKVAGGISGVTPAVTPKVTPVTPEVKEPWQMTREEWANYYGSVRYHSEYLDITDKMQKLVDKTGKTTIELRDEGNKEYLNLHKAMVNELAKRNDHYEQVEKAVKEGKPVPAEVLATYPDLAKALPQAEAGIAETTAMAEGETVTGEIPEGEVTVEVTDMAMSPTELSRIRQNIMAVGKVKGLSQTALNQLFRDVVGRTPDNRQMPWRLTEMTDEQLRDTLEIIKTARPVRIGTKIVIRPSTERKIQSLKQSLISEGKLTEEAFNDMVNQLKLPATRYETAKKFITEKEGKSLIRLMNDEAEIGLIQRHAEANKALNQNPAVKEAYDDYSNRILKQGQVYFEGKPADTSILKDMRFAMEDLQIRTGKPFYDTYFLLNRAKNANVIYSYDAGLRFVASTPEYKKLITNPDSMKRIRDYMAAKNKWAKAKSPKDITPEEVKLANAYEKELFDLQPDFKYHRFLHYYQSTGGDIAKMHEHIPDAPVEDLQIAVNIYEKQGATRLRAYLDTKTWGVIGSGYEPHYVVSPQLAMRKLKATFPTRRFEPRTNIEFYPEDITIDHAVRRYVRQVKSYNLRPYVRKLERIYAEAIPQLKNPQKINLGISVMTNEMLGYKDRSFFGELIMKAASQAYITVFGTFPTLPFRNLFQNLAHYPDKSALVDPRNKKMTDWDWQFYDTHVSQMKGVEKDLLLAEEGGLPGFRRLNRFILRLNLYGASDSKVNRIWSQWASLNKAQRALDQYKTDGNIDKFISNSGMAGLTLTQQKQVLENLVMDKVNIAGLPSTTGEHAAITEIATEITNNVHFLYDRSQRAWLEMGETGRLVGSLVVFPRSVIQRAIIQGKVFAPNDNSPPVKKKRAFKILFSLLWGSLAANYLFQKATGRKDAPYSPFNVLKWSPGGLTIGAATNLAEVAGLLFMAMGGDDYAKTQLPAAITKTSDTFVPYYKVVIQALEAAADKKQIDRQLYRELRSIIEKAMVDMGFLDKAYEPNESYYEAVRSGEWKIKHALFGTEPEESVAGNLKDDFARDVYGRDSWNDLTNAQQDRFYRLRPDLK